MDSIEYVSASDSIILLLVHDIILESRFPSQEG